MWTGRINSTVIVVSVPLLVPLANVVTGDVVGRAELAFRLGPGSSGGSPSGAARLGRGYFAPSRSQARREYAQMHSVGSSLIRDYLDEPARNSGRQDGRISRIAHRRVCSLSASTRRPTVCGWSGVAGPLVVIDPDIRGPGSQLAIASN